MSWLKTSLLACSVSVLLLLCPPRVHARPLRALVCVVDQADRALLERLHGQTADLDVRLLPVACDAPAADFDTQLASARALAGARGAELAIWFLRKSTRLVVYVADLTSERVLARALDSSLPRGSADPGAERHAASARDEAVALVVRSAVRASLAGAALDTPPAERVAITDSQRAPPVPATAAPASQPIAKPRAEASQSTTKPPVAEPKRASEEPKPASRRAVRAVRSARARRVAIWLTVGGQGGRDGFARFGRYALGGRLGVGFGRVEIGVSALAGLPAPRAVRDIGRLVLARHRFGVYGAVALIARDTLRLALDLGAGAELSTLRLTRSTQPDFRVQAPRALLSVLTASLRGSYLPRWAHGRLALVVGAGISALPERPLIGFRQNGAFVPVRRLHAIEPLLELALAGRF